MEFRYILLICWCRPGIDVPWCVQIRHLSQHLNRLPNRLPNRRQCPHLILHLILHLKFIFWILIGHNTTHNTQLPYLVSVPELVLVSAQASVLHTKQNKTPHRSNNQTKLITHTHTHTHTRTTTTTIPNTPGVGQTPVSGTTNWNVVSKSAQSCTTYAPCQPPRHTQYNTIQYNTDPHSLSTVQYSLSLPLSHISTHLYLHILSLGIK